MPDLPFTALALPWPKCPRWKADRTECRDAVETFPPDPVFARCGDCGHEWAMCGAKTSVGKRCASPPMPNGRCDKHGGRSTGRPLLHGRRSKFLPTRLQERAEEALADAELVSLLEDLALIDALTVERYGQLGDDTHAELWGRALSCLSELEGHRQDGGLAMEPEAGAVFDRLRDALRNGEGRAKAEKEILGLQEQKRRLAETELKRLHALSQFVSARELNVLMAALVAAVNGSVKDPHERAEVGRKIAAFVRPAIG